MVFYVGIQLDSGVAVAYSKTKKLNYELRKAPKNVQEFSLMLDRILTKCDEALECICISLKNRKENEFRKKIIKAALTKGFSKVEIIDEMTSKYYSAISQTKHIPKNDEIVWIINDENCEVWKIINQKACYNPILSTEYSNGIFKRIIEKQKYNLLPTLIITDVKNNKLIAEKISSKCKIFCSNIQNGSGALIKARKMTGDYTLTAIDATSLLDRKITVKVNGKLMSSFEEKEKLPLIRSLKVESVMQVNTIEITEEENVVNVIPPKFKEFLLVINIDTNGIYETTFEKVPINPIISVDNYIEAVYFETQKYTISTNDLTLIKGFQLPEFSNSCNKKSITGIHSGNWKTSAAIWANNKVKDISLGENEDEIVMASHVQFDDDENVKCGLIDFEGVPYPSSSVYDIKTLIGKYLNEITLDKSWLFQLTETSNMDGFIESMQEKLGINYKTGVLIESFCGPVIKCPEEIFALLLKHVKTKAEEQQNQKLSDAIITVPGTYSESQKTTTRIAGLLAGWENIFLLPESIATMFANFLEVLDSENSSPMILADLGHAAFNICVFKIVDEKIHILHNSADSCLGGREYDNLLFEYFQKQLQSEFGFNVSKKQWPKFIFYCKDIKHLLSFRENYRLYIEDIDASVDGYVDITRKHFQKMADNLLDKTQDFIYSTLNSAGFEAHQIGAILHTGGGCRMPMIKLLLRQTFPKAKHYADDYPINTVAVGAASYVSAIKNNESELESSGMNSVKERMIPEDTEVDAVGIDLGTTRCCVAVNRPMGIETIGLENEGNRLLPSYVAFDEKHDKFGKIVIHRMRDHSKSTAFDAKRLLGKEFNEIKIDENWTFTVISYGNKVKLQLTTHEGETLKYPEEISTSLLKHLKEKTEQFQTKELSEVVITIPTAFNEKQTKSTYVAAILAGWKKVHLISESVAAALAYSLQNPLTSSTSSDSDLDSGILVFDLGGGTLDVCIFKYKNDAVEIIGRSGDPNLGGRDFDKLIIDYIMEKLQTEFNVTVPKSKKYLLITKSQEIKENLSFLFDDSFFVDDIDFTSDSVLKITRTEFELMSKNLIQKAKEVVFKAINNAGFDTENIGKVIQVGGGCRMPMIKELIKEIFPNAEHCCVTNPDEVVAVGAAHYSFNLNSKKL